MRFGTGHIPDPYDPRDHHFGGPEWQTCQGVARAENLPSLVDLSPQIDVIQNQLVTGACVAEGFNRAIHLRARLQGTPIPFPSVLATYVVARRNQHPLTDDGSIPRMAAMGLQEFGCVAEERWPFDAAKVNSPLPWDVYQHGADAKVAGYYRISGTGDDRCAQIRSALAHGYPVPFAMQVGDRFQAYKGGILTGEETGKIGGHMTCLVGYGPDWFLAVNSWSDSWGIRGFYLVSPDRIGGPTVSDVYVLTIAPKDVT